MKIGIFGGSFDPVHIGHTYFAREVVTQLDLDFLYIIPCAQSPHTDKHLSTDQVHRYKMTKLAFGNNKKYRISDCEIKRKGKSYTIDTINYLQNKHPNATLHLIIGSDLLPKFNTWKNYHEIIEKVKIAVVIRSEGVIVPEKFAIINIPKIELSSSYIRSELYMNKTVEYLVHPKVESYINKHKLYRK